MDKNIIIAAGGTGGHVVPALTVAKQLRDSGCKILWIGTSKGIESSLVPKENFALEYIQIQGVRGKKLWTQLLSPLVMFSALWQSMKIIRRNNVDSVLVFGGYVSGPVGLAAFLLGKKLIIHEQNSVAGTTNKILAKFAHVILSAYPKVFDNYKNCTVSGNPIRSFLLNISEPTKRLDNRDGPLRILVLGGSGGALFLNQNIPALLQKISEKVKIEVIHQCGPKNFEATQLAYQNFPCEFNIFEYIQNMQEVYEWADFAICRAGALTVSELTAVGLGSLLIPFPHAIDDHQAKNAEYLVATGAALMIRQSDFVLEIIAEKLIDILSNRKKVISMAQNARSLAMVNSTDLICDSV